MTNDIEFIIFICVMNISDLISKLDADWESLFDRVIESANLDEKEKETLSIARKIVSSIQNQKIETKNSAIARALGNNSFVRNCWQNSAKKKKKKDAGRASPISQRTPKFSR